MVKRQLNFLSCLTHFSRIVCLSSFVLELILIIVSVCVYKRQCLDLFHSSAKQEEIYVYFLALGHS